MSENTKVTKKRMRESTIIHRRQGRPQADPTDAAALGPAPLGPRAVVFGKIIHFARYTLRLRIQ